MDDWERHAREELSPKVRDANVVVSLVTDEPDPKICLETGYAIWLNKPIIAVVRPGTTAPPGILRIAHSVIYLEHELSTLAGQAELQVRLMEAYDALENPDESTGDGRSRLA